MDQPVSKISFLLFSSHQYPSRCLPPRRLRFYLVDTRPPTSPVQLKSMSNLPNPPDPASNNPHLRDITLATITTFAIGKHGEEKEVSCVALQDLVEADPESIPTQMNTAWISRLSYHKWVEALIEDLAYRTHEVIQLHKEWKIWIPGSRQLKVSPNDHGFRAAITKWFAFHSESPDSDITFFIKRLSIEERNSRYVLSILDRH